jgi:hypothetical protein
MGKRIKVIVVVFFVLFGAALLCYGAFYHAARISIPDNEKSEELIKAEPALIKLVTIDGLKRDKSGNISQTFGKNEKAPKACPT